MWDEQVLGALWCGGIVAGPALLAAGLGRWRWGHWPAGRRAAVVAWLCQWPLLVAGTVAAIVLTPADYPGGGSNEFPSDPRIGIPATALALALAVAVGVALARRAAAPRAVGRESSARARETA